MQLTDTSNQHISKVHADADIDGLHTVEMTLE